MSYLSSDSRDRENLDDFEDKKPPNYPQNEINLYQKHKENAANRRFQGSAEGIPSISQEDFRLLRECNKESFWYRCLPLSVGICAVMFYLANQRNMRPKTWHILSGTFGGWFVGKLSYRRVCENRLINSDSHSPFVTAMRRRRGIYKDDGLDTGMASEAPPEPTNPYWEQQSKNEAFGYGAQEFADFKDDENRNKDEEMSFTTYDDLRAKNRASYKPRPFSSSSS